MMSLIDPAIAREMDEDLAALSKRSGVDIEKNVIGQIGDQVAVGGSAQVVPAIGVMATLKDPAVVKTAIEGLIDYAGLETDTHAEGKRWFVTLKGRDWPVTLGIDGDRLIIGSMPQATRAMVEARDGKRRLLDSADFRALYATLPREKAMLAFVDLAVQFRRMEELRDAGIEIPEEPMFAVASLTGRGDTAHASLRLSPRVEQLLTQALHRAAAQARRTSSLNNLRQLALAAMLFANVNEDRLPSSWSDIVPYIEGNEGNLQLVVSPNDPRDVKVTKDNIDATASYLFNETLRGAKLPGIERPHATPLFAEPIAFYNGKGTNFAYADGHVEWLGAEEAKKLLERMKKEKEEEEDK
jgi:prepilin-type processing-associated H-X9-DG protein